MDAKDSVTLSSAQEVCIARRIAVANAIRHSIVGMNVKDIRRLRLLQLQKKHGTLDRIAHNIDPGKKYLAKYLSQILTGRRDMGDTLANRIETCEGRPEGWMDTMGTTSLEAGELLKIWGQFPESEQQRIIDELSIRLRVLQDKEHQSALGEAAQNHPLPKHPRN